MLKRAVITEKSTKAIKANKYSFAVVPESSKKQIKEMVEKTYNVHVLNVWTTTKMRKKKRVGFSRRYSKPTKTKRAIVQLKEGEKIEIFQTGD